MLLEGNLGYLLSFTTQNEKVFMQHFSNSCMKIYKQSGKKALEEYLYETKKKEGVSAFFYLPDYQVISLIPPSTYLQNSITQTKKNFLFSNFYRLNKYYVFVKKDSGSTYKVVIDVSMMKSPFSLFSLPIILRTLLALIILSLTFYTISRLLYAPLKIIINSITKISQGKLDTRISHLFRNRHDELHQMGNDFDKMAKNIEYLVSSKEETLRFVAHEFRTPLAKMRMALSLIEQKSTHQCHQDLIMIDKQISQMDKLIDEILTVAKLNTPNLAIEKKTFDLVTLLSKLVDETNYEFATKRIKFHSPPKCLFNGNKKLIKRAIENLLRNALFYTPHDSDVTLKIEKNNDKVSLFVIDSGNGIPESEITSIFEPFKQSDIQLSSNSNGYGLGLAIVKKIVAIHHGEISAKNLKPHGLKVFLSFITST